MPDTTPRPSDSRLTRWKKILWKLQALAGADPSDDPKRSDTLRRTKVKILRAANNT